MGRFLVCALCVSFLSSANAASDLEKYLTVSQVEMQVETLTDEGSSVSTLVEELAGMPHVDGNPGQKANIGQVIIVAKELIALGERVYEIVKKGKPVLNMSFAPISVLPKKADGSAVDILDTEGWAMPKAHKVRMVYKNLYGVEVVSFNYTLVFAHSGSYDGKGAYITAAQIMPANVRVSWGFELNATMKLVGLQNHGSRQSPVAGAVLGVNYKVESVLSTIDTTDTFHITGRGQLTQL